jgi:hypothetical protein
MNSVKRERSYRSEEDSGGLMIISGEIGLQNSSALRLLTAQDYMKPA